MSNDQPSLHALLVGIDTYINQQEAPTLDGCVDDVEVMEQLLREKYGVPDTQIKKLVDEQATHAAIKEAFRTHLIGAAKAWDAAGRPGTPPAFLFHYSGHGAQARDKTGTEPDGMDETLVPHDSRTAGVYDIKDWELGLLLEELTAYSDNVTVVLDCCHSGSGTRASRSGLRRTRRALPDTRPQPTGRPQPATGTPGTRGVSGPSGWQSGGKYVLLAGCRDREESNEYADPESPEERVHGAMTFFLVRELTQARADRPLTYRELYERVSVQVNTIFPDQMPQCEGDRDREIFGGVRPQRDFFLSVVEARDGLLWVDGGAAHGLTVGSILRLYPRDARTLEEAGAPVATVEVEEVGAIRSGCRLSDGNPADPVGMRAAIERLNLGNMRSRVVLDVGDETRRKALVERLETPELAGYVEVVDGSAGADLRVVAVDDTLELQDTAGTLLVAPFKADDVKGVADDLAHVVRYRNALNLRNTAAHSDLAGAVTLAVKGLEFDPATQQPRAVDLPKTEGGETVVEVGQRVVFEITNDYDRDLHVVLLNFDPAWEVARLYPPVAGAHELLEVGRTLQIGLSRRPREQMVAGLPNGFSEGRDIFKVIATVEDADFEALEQGPLKTPFQTRAIRSGAGGPASALDRLLAQAREGGRTRAWGPPPNQVEDDWTTAEVETRTVRPAAAPEVSQRLADARPANLAAYQLQVTAPPGFQGNVRVLTPRQATRAAGGDSAALADLRPPPGLAGFPDHFQAIGLGGTRGLEPAGAVIEIEADAAARRQITDATPLTIRLGQGRRSAGEPSDGTLAVAFDGSFYYPVGRAGANGIVQVGWLPDPDQPADGPRRRSLGRTVKLYLFKLAGISDPTLGLHRARFVPAERIDSEPPDDERVWKTPGGQARYRTLRPGEIQAGQRVALFVHGFQSETPWMVSGPAEHFRAQGLGYDHVLTFDYESFNTSIRDNGFALAEALRGAGFGSVDGVTLDVFAHSMGTLVTRTMIELAGGDELVRRAFLAGPPNVGTRLARLARFGVWLATLLLNQAGAAPPVLVANWALGKVSSDAVGVRDLRPDSEIIAELNRLPGRPTVPYHLLIGSNEVATDELGAWDRLRRKVLQGVDAVTDAFFAGDNDLVIDVKSMGGLRDGRYPADLLQTLPLPCNHFAYFDLPEAQQQLVAWLKSGTG